LGSEPGLAAGEFSSWLAVVEGALRGEHGVDVPCDGCTACCTSSQFVVIAPDETDAIAHIPPALLFPAPRRPKGYLVMGYDDRGHCPMLVDGGCSIYEHRPQTCRTYDCRVFPASGLDVGEDGKPLIAERARRWRFSYATPESRAEQEAVLAAARFVREQTPPADVVPPVSATGQAVLAIELHGLFRERAPDASEVWVEVRRRTRGDDGYPARR